MAKQQVTNNSAEDLRLQPSIDETPNLVSEFIMDDKLTNLDEYGSAELDNYIAAYDQARESIFPATSSYSNKDLSIQDFDLNNPEHFSYLSNHPEILNPKKKLNPELKDPIINDKFSVNYDRYFFHPEFDELGFNPNFNMEQYYNENSGAWDDFGRTLKATWGTIKGGYLSAPRSAVDLFTDDPYFDTPDFKTAAEFAYSTKLAQSTRGGMTAFANNTFNQLGYSIGMLGEILTEELLILGATAAGSSTGVGAIPSVAGGFLASVRNAWKATKLPRMFSKQGRVAGSLLKSLERSMDAKTVYNGIKSTGRWTIDRLTPNTIKAYQKSRSAQKFGDKISDLAVAANTFGGFYRDVRALNFAVSEGKLEAGLRFSDSVDELSALQLKQNNGEPLTPEQFADINDKAMGAAVKTLHWNIPLIYLTNQLVFGKALRGFNPKLGQIFKPTRAAYSKDLTKTAVKGADGKIIKNVVEDVAEKTKTTFGQRLKSLKLPKKGEYLSAAKGGMHSSLRFFSANLGEGAQELYQEAVSAGFGEYFKEMYTNPGFAEAESLLLDLEYIGRGTKAEGFSFETFASGFVVGGVMGAGSNFVMDYMPNKFSEISRKRNPEKADEYTKQKNKFRDDLNNLATEQLSGKDAGQNLFKDRALSANMAAQNEASREMRGHEYLGDEGGFTDTRDYALFEHFKTLMRPGAADLFAQKIEDIKNLEDTDLIDYLTSEGNDKSEAEALVKSGKYRQGLENSIDQLRRFQDKYDKINSKYPIPFDLSKIDQTKEGGKLEYANTVRNINIWEHTKKLMLFTSEGFDRARERSQQLNNSLKTSKVLDKVAANDISAVTDKTFLQTEIKVLKTEIEALEASDDKTSLADKKKRLELLEKYQEILKKGTLKNGGLSTSKSFKDKVKKSLREYFKYVGSLNNDYINEEEFSKFVDRALDRFQLDTRAAQYNKTLEYLNNPKRFVELFERVTKSRLSDYAYSRDSIVDAQEERLDRRERGLLINDFKSLDVYPDPEEVKEFLATGDVSVLKTFFKANEKISVDDANPTSQKIKQLIKIWEVRDVLEQEEKKAQETKTEDVYTDEANETTTYINLISNDPYAKAIVDNVFRKDRNLNQDGYLTLDQWSESERGKRVIDGVSQLKRTWFEQDLSKDASIDKSSAVYQDGIGFTAWLKNNIDNPAVQQVFLKYGFDEQDLVVSGEKPEGKKGKHGIVKPGPGINIQETIIPESGKPFYMLVDNKGKRFSNSSMPEGVDQNSFISLDKAIQAYNALLPAFKDGIFSFGKDSQTIQLRYKDLVENTKGEKFIFLGTSDLYGKGNEILLLPYEQRNLKSRQERRIASITEPIDGFENRGYSKVEGKIVQYNKLSKLFVKELIGSYGYKTINGESVESAQLRFERVISLLDNNELNNLSINIKKNDNGKDTYTSLSIPGYDRNNFIKSLGSDVYTIEIKISSDTLNNLMKKGLSQEDASIISENNTIGFIRNFRYTLVDTANKPVNIFNLSDAEVAKRYLRLEGSDNLELKAEQFRKAYADQAYFSLQLGKVTKDGPVSLTFEDLNKLGVGFKIPRGQFTFNDNNKNRISDLEYSTYDGAGVLLVGGINPQTGEVTEEIIVSSDASNATEIKKEVRAKLKESKISSGSQNLYYKGLIGMGRYTLVVKDPTTGVLTLAEVQQDPYTEENLSIEFGKMIERSLLSFNQNTNQETNEKGKATLNIKDKAFNKVFNDEIREKIYIASIPGSDVSVRVSPTGIIEFEFFNETVTNKNGVNGIKVIHQVKPSLIENKYKDNPLELMQEVASFQKKVNEELSDMSEDLSVSFDKESFRVTFSKTATFEEIAENVFTTLDKNVSKPSSEIQVIVDSDKTAAYKNTFNVYLSEQALNLTQVEELAAKVSRKENIKPGLTQEEETYYNNNKEKVDEAVPVQTSLDFGGNTLIGEVAEKEEPASEEKTLLDSLESKLKALQKQEQEEIDKANRSKNPKEARRKIRNKLAQLRIEQQKLISSIDNIVRGIGKTGDRLIPSESLAVDTFTNWARKTLPDFINVEDIRQLGIKLKNEGTNVGQFSAHLYNLAGDVKVGGTIYTGAPSTALYHEGFHAVFRLLLTTEQQKKFLSIARKAARAELRAEGLSLQQELNKLREQYPKYKDYSAKDLEKIYYEEWLADQFERFKINPRSTKVESSIKSWFNRIIEWIKALFSSTTKNELTSLFEQIDAGKYKNTPVQSNDFVRHIQEGVSIDVYKNITKSYTTSADFLDPIAARDLIRTITASYINRAEAVDTYVVEDILDDLIFDYEELYDPNNEIYKDHTPTQRLQLKDIHDALRYQGGAEIKEAVTQYINSYISKIEKLKDTLEAIDASVGGRTVDNFDLDASNIGGHSALPFKVRVFIATQTVDNTDAYGNPKLSTGETLQVPVVFEDVFYGLTKAMANKNNLNDMLYSANEFAKRNKQTRAVLNNFFRTVNIDVEKTLETKQLVPLNSNNPINTQFFHQFVKSFRNEKLEYFVVHKDSNSGKVLKYSASIKDAAKNQIIGWRNNWFSIYNSFSGNPEAIESAGSTLEEAINLFRTGNPKEDSFIISEKIKSTTGIVLSPAYVEYSMLSHKLNEGQKLDPEDKAFVTSNADQVVPIFETEETADLSEIRKLITTQKIVDNNLVYNPSNIFLEEGEGDALTRITKFANNNALLDETIGTTVFLNAENKLIYAHQMPTYHLTEVRSLNDTTYVDGKIKKSNGFLDNNVLYNSPAFKEMQNKGLLKVVSVDGLKVGSLQGKESVTDLSLDERNHEGVKYGSLSAMQFAQTNLELYTLGLNTKSGKAQTVTYEDSEGNKQQKALAPVNIRVMEAANKGDFVMLPVIKAVEMKNNKVVLSEEAIDFYYNDIKNEFDRISTETKRHFPDGQITDNVELDIDAIVGYNTIDKIGQQVGIKIDENDSSKNIIPRAFKFFFYSEFFSPDIISSLEQLAREGKTFEEALKSNQLTNAKIRSLINDKVIGDAKTVFESMGRNITDSLDGTLAKLKDADLLNITDNIEYNIKQIVVNEWINTSALTNLMMGDHSKLFKNANIDVIKRAKGNNGAYVNVESYLGDAEMNITPLGDESIQAYAVTDKVLKSSLNDDSIDSTDAQIWGTINGLAHFLHGMGDLSASHKKLLKKLQANEIIESEEWESFKKDGAIINSEKFIYFDGEKYVKMSYVALIPELTTKKDGTPIQGREALHNLRLSLEASESQGKVSVAVPQSASKMLTSNVTVFDQAVSSENSLEDSKPMLLNARHFGRQMVVPSNKKQITSLSQIQTLVLSEHNANLKDTVLINGETIKIKDVKDRYKALSSAGVDLNYNNRVKLLFDLLPYADDLDSIERRKMFEPNLINFLRFAHESLKRSHASGNTLELFSLKEEFGSKFQKYDLNNPLTIDQYEMLFLSFFNNKVMIEKVEGHSHSLVSLEMLIPRRVYNTSGNKIDRQEAIRQTQFDDSKVVPGYLRADSYEYDSDFVKAIQDEIEKTGQPVIVLDRLRSNLKEYLDPKEPSSYTKQYYSETMYASHYKEVTDELLYSDKNIPDVIAKSQSTRVPSQDKHSAMNTRLVDFLPLAYGSTASFAKEIVQITGADFDIDKAYTSTKEWYYDKENKTFVQYGASSRDKSNYGDGFKDYAEYVNKKVMQPGSYLNEALFKYTNNLAARGVIYDNDGLISYKASRALSILNLPGTKESYIKYREDNNIEPYNAAINNELLDLKFALIGYEGMSETRKGLTTPIAYTPLDLEPLENAIAFLDENTTLVKQRDFTGLDINSIPGKVKAWKTIKEAGGAIGTVVVPNLVVNAFAEANIKLFSPIFLDGQKYQEFNQDFSKRKDGVVERTQTVLDALISGVVDDAKYNYLSKAALNRPALRVATYMSALGVPLSTTLALLNVEQIISSMSNNISVNTNIIKQSLLEIEESGLLSPADIKKYSVEDLTQDDLLDIINEPPILNSELVKELTREEKDIQFKKAISLFKALNKFREFSEVATQSNRLIPFFNMISKGMGDTNFDAVNDRVSSEQFLGLSIANDKTFSALAAKNSLVGDFRNLFKADGYLNTELKIHKNFSEKILPNLFMTFNPKFLSIYNSAEKNFRDKGLHRNLMSYLISKAYLNKDISITNSASLTNAYLYDTDNEFNIVKTFQALKDADVDSKNYFLTNYIYSQFATDASNNSGMNLIESNTFGKIGEAEKLKIQEGFQRIFVNPDTYRNAMDIVHNQLVKDGLQFKKGSLIESMSMPSLEIILQSTADVMQALKGQRSFEDVFGLNEFDLRKEFLFGYGKSSSSSKTLGISTRNTPTESGGRLVTNNSAEPLKLPIYFSLGVNEVYRINENVINEEALEKGFVELGTRSSVTYDRVKEEGSFTQNPMGFVFGPRPLFEELVPSLVENEVTAVKKTPSKLQQALSQDKQIVATEDTIEISQKVNPTDDPFNGNYEVLEEIQSTQQTSEVEIEVTNKKYSRNSLDNDSSSMYLFTDNAERTSRPNATSSNITEGWYAEKYKDKTDKPLHYGSESNPTSAVIRGKNNAYPISTMSAYGTNWTNENFDLFKITIDDEINQIKQDLPKFKTLKLGNFRIGQGGRFAKLPSQHQSYLDSKLLELGIDNSGDIPKVNKPTQQTSLEFGGNTLVDPADYDSSSEASKQSDDNSVSLKLTKFHSEELLLEASRLNEIRNERGLDVDTPEKLIEEYNKLNKVTGGAYSADQFIDMIKQCYI